MRNLDINVLHLDELQIFGLWGKSNDKTISNDIKILSKNIIPWFPYLKVKYFLILYLLEIMMNKVRILKCL